MSYASPARPWAFGPFVGEDIVAWQAEALVQRYDLLDALGAGGHVRRDLNPRSAADPTLRAVVARQLVRWVDYVPEPDARDEGWPIAQGVRVEALCYSSWLDGLRADGGKIGGKQVFTLPGSAAEFARQFHLRSGILIRTKKAMSPEGLDQEFLHGFRMTPLIVGKVAMTLRTASPAAERAFRLLASREYEAAGAADTRLLAPHPLLQSCGFEDDAIVAFERLDEVARIGMLVREVDRLAVAGSKLNALLQATNHPEFVEANSTAAGVAYAPDLATALASDAAMLTLCEYLAVGTDVLASWRNGVVANRGIFHPKFRPEAFLTRGSIESDTAAALAWSVDVRTAFLSAFEPPRAGKAKEQMLSNDMVAKFYGVSNFRSNLAAALMADFNTTRRSGPPPGSRFDGPIAKERSSDVRDSIATIVAHLGRDGNPQYAGLQTVRTGAPLSRIMLPQRSADGAAARADDSMCRDRYRDQPFWTRFQSPGPSWYAQLSMRPRDRDILDRAIRDLRRLAVGNLGWLPSSLTARVISDLATGVSAISVNPAFARSLRALVKLNGLIVRAEKRWGKLNESRRRALEMLWRLGRYTHGHRRIEQIEAISNPARLRQNDERGRG